MKNNNLLYENINKKPVAEVQYLENEKVPTIEEMKNGAKLPKEYVEKLLNPDAKFDGDLEVYCYVCSKSVRETDLKVSCPAPSCSGGARDYWYHNRDGCRGSRMKISNRGTLRCPNCSTSGKVGYWLFICSDHGGTPQYTTSGAFRRALCVVLGSDDCDEVITDLGAYISDPKHKNEWFN